MNDTIETSALDKPVFQRIRTQRKLFAIADSELQTLELGAKGLVVKQPLQPTDLPVPWLRAFEKVHSRLEAYNEGPGLVSEAIEFFIAHHKQAKRNITLRELLSELILAKGTPSVDGKQKRSPYTVIGWIAGVNAICNKHGTPTGRLNCLGKQEKDIKVRALTAMNFKALEARYGWQTAQHYTTGVSAVLQFGVDQGYFDNNCAAKVKFEPDKNNGEPEDIEILTNEQVQKGVNVAAQLRGARPLPIITLEIFGALRPESEIPFFSWKKMNWQSNSVTVYSSKTRRTRTVELCVVAMEILKWCFENGIEPECTLSDRAIIRMAMGYFDERCPMGLWPEHYEDYDLITVDAARHTGNSNWHRYNPDYKEGARWSDDTIDTYRRFYVNGKVARGMAAQFYVIWPDLLPKPPELTNRIREELVRQHLLNERDPLPQPPVVPRIVIHCRQPQSLPTIPDDELGKRIWKTSVSEVAADLKMNRVWLTGYCLAKQIPLPPPGQIRFRKCKYEDAPKPPRYIPITDQALHDLIWAEMGIVPAARKLGLNPYWVKAHCVVHRINVPSRGQAWGKGVAAASKKRVFLPLEEVKELLKTTDYRKVAKHFQVSEEKLIRFCHHNQIDIPGRKYRGKRGAYSIEVHNPEPQAVVSGIPPQRNRQGRTLRMKEVQRLLKRMDHAAVAQSYGIDLDQFLDFCRARELRLPTTPSL